MLIDVVVYMANLYDETADTARPDMVAERPKSREESYISMLNV